MSADTFVVGAPHGGDADCDSLAGEAAACSGACGNPGPAGDLLSISESFASYPYYGRSNLAVAWTGRELAALSARLIDDFYPYSSLCLHRYDPEGVAIAQNCATDRSLQPLFVELASSGSDYLVAMTNELDDRYDRCSPSRACSTKVVKLDSEGNPASPVLTVPGPASDSHAPAVLWTGREYVLAWGDDSLWFARIDATAENVLDSRRIAMSGDPDGSVQPSLVATTDGYLVGWRDHLLRLDPLGIVKDDSVYAAGASAPCLVGTGAEFGLAWVDNRPEAPGLYFRRLTPTGEPVGTPTRLTRTPSGDAPLVAWTGSEFGVAHESRFFRIDSAGDVIGAAHDLAHPVARPRTQGLLWTGSDYAVSGLDSEYDPVQYFSILGCRCPDTDGDGVNACLDCDDANADVYPRAPALCDGINNDCLSPSYPDLFGTIDFDDDRDGVSECQGDCNDRFVDTYSGAFERCDAFDNDCDGSVDEGSCDTTCDGLDVIDSATFPYPSLTRLVWNGVGYGFLDEEGTDTGDYVLRYVDTDGRVLTPSLLPKPILPPGSSCGFGGCSTPPLTLLWNGSEFVVGDDGLLFVTPSGDVRRVRFQPAGMSGDSAIDFLQSDGNHGYLVAWFQEPYHDPRYIGRLDADGRLIGSPVEKPFRWIGVGPTATEIVVVSGNSGGATFQRFTESWEPIGGPVAFSRQFCGDVFWTGVEYGVRCDDGSFLRLDPTGNPLGQPVALGAKSMVWNGTEYGAIVGSGFRRFDSAGSDLGSIDLQGCDPYEIAWNGAEYALLGKRNREPCFVRVGCNCFDDDGDGFSSCVECDDLHAEVYPGAPQICDRYNNDCDAADWPVVRPDEADQDADGVSICDGDCDDTDETIYPAAPELCDGRANDCNASGWPQLPADETDGDADGFRGCENDCDDSDPRIHPASPESCNSKDDDCNLLVDEDDAGEDSDADDVGNVCDNCRFDFNPRQEDRDGDAAGDVCDNCAFDYNPRQSDLDGDFEGDLCDLDDGMIYVTASKRHRIDWQGETGYSSWNVYRGDLGALKTTATYTQVPGSNPLVDRQCGLKHPFAKDSMVPAKGEVAFYLVTGRASGIEGGLGPASSGAIRPNANPCP